MCFLLGNFFSSDVVSGLFVIMIYESLGIVELANIQSYCPFETFEEYSKVNPSYIDLLNTLYEQ